MRRGSLLVTLLVAACAPPPLPPAPRLAAPPAVQATPSSVAPSQSSSRRPLEDTLRSLAAMGYPDAELREKAVSARLGAAIGVCRRPGTEAMSDEDFQALASAVPAALHRALKVARDRPFPCSEAETTEARRSIDELAATFSSELAWRPPAFDPSAPILLRPDRCRCDLDQLDHAATAFYPYWLRGKAPAVPLRALHTIAYVGLTFDDAGQLRHVEAPSGGGAAAGDPIDPARAELVVTAHAAGIGVDWVIQRSDWTRWSARPVAERRRAFEALAPRLAELSGKDPRDGVTLFFTGYPSDDDSVAMFGHFVSAIVAKQGPNVPGRVNILVPQPAVGAGPYAYPKLLELVKQLRPESERGEGGAVYVLLEEPTTESKKRLRKAVEDELHGQDRMRLLTAIVPVIELDGRSWQQLSDDEVYFADNYGGLGFWLTSAELKPR